LPVVFGAHVIQVPSGSLGVVSVELGPNPGVAVEAAVVCLPVDELSDIFQSCKFVACTHSV
jgi:hypothetical protein